MNSLKSRNAVCANCSGDRNCNIVGHHTEQHRSDHYDADTDWYLLKCQGCGYTFLQTVSTNSEETDYSYGKDGETECEYIETTKYYPALTKRKKPAWFHDWGIEAENTEAIHLVLREVYYALEADLPILAAIGIRTAFDVSSGLLNVDPNFTFSEKLNELIRLGHVKISDKVSLEMLVEAGSATAHRGWMPVTRDLNVMMDVLEYFIYHAFVLPAIAAQLNDKAAKIKESVPIRTQRKP